MADAKVSTRPSLRHAREAVLALCTLWLVVQNIVLLAFVPWHRLPEAGNVLATVLKTAALVLGPLWVLGSAALLGWALISWLDRGPRGAAAGIERGLKHGRAR